MEYLVGPIDHHHSPPMMHLYDPEFDSSSSSSDPDHSSSSPSDSGASNASAGMGAGRAGVAAHHDHSGGGGWSSLVSPSDHAFDSLSWTGAHEASPPPSSSSIDDYGIHPDSTTSAVGLAAGTRLIDVELAPLYAHARGSLTAAGSAVIPSRGSAPAAAASSSSSSQQPTTVSSDFWSTAPSTTVHSPATPATTTMMNGAGPGSGTNHEPRKKQLEDQMEVEFEQVVHGHECGPSTIASPAANHSQSASFSASNSSSSATATNDSHYSMSMPVDLLAVNAGIAPRLMGGEPSPPLNASRQVGATKLTSATTSFAASKHMKEDGHDDDEMEEDQLQDDEDVIAKAPSTQPRPSRSSNDGDSSNPGSREPSQSRKTSTTSPSLPFVPGPSLNLVTKDAVIASTVLTNSTRDIDRKRVGSAAGLGDVQLLVLGVPTSGAKSRVETQIKISLVLVKDKQFKKASTSAAAIAGPSSLHGDKFLTIDGGLDPSAAQSYDRIVNWSHIRLPSTLALKKKPSKKQSKPIADSLPQDTLALEVAVTRGTEPHEEITICTGCQQREMKRAQRKKGNKSAALHGEELTFDPEEEKQKVVVFNCGEYIDFHGGETVIPTRITCYCRHHKERKGFVVVFKLKDHEGRVVALGKTPPIMITDDHKTSSVRPAHSADVSVDSIEPPAAPSVTPSVAPSVASSSKSSTTKKSKSTKKKKEKVESVISAAALALRGRSKPTKRTTNRSKAARGQTESDDEAVSSTNGGLSSVNLSRSSSRSEPTSSSSKKGKPYDSDNRPRKRATNGSHRSPSFAMTPLVQPSPPLRPVPDVSTTTVPSSTMPSPLNSTSSATAAASHPPSQIEQWESALGLVGGMGDAMMTDVHVMRNNSISHSTDVSTAPSPARSSSTHFDWASATNSPHMSPRSATTSVDESFQSFFNSLSSPPPLTTTNTPAMSAAARSPALESQATLAHRHLQQQQQQHFQQQPHQQQPLFANGLGGPFGSGVATATGMLSANGSTSNVATPSATNGPNGIDWSLLQNQMRTPAMPSAPQPRISRLIPGEGPVHGGIEVTVLGDNFVPNLTCVFGDHAAVPTHYWSSNTLVCVLPPSANPGPVVVGIKGVPLTVEQGTGLQLFTYKDDSDRSLLELALQVVGLKMTGRLEDASAVAMRIVGNGNGNNGGGSANGSRTTSPIANGGPMDAASLAMSLEAAASSVYSTPGSSRPSSRTHSRRPSSASQSGTSSPIPTTAPLPYSPAGETRNFEGIVIKFLSLLDLDPSLIPGSAPSLPLERSPISHANAQGHTLLHLATVLGFHRLAQFLVARQIDIDARDRNGYTALHFAALYGRVAITRRLVDSGAATGMRNLAGKIALDIAQERDDVDVEDILHRSRPATTYTPRPAHPMSMPQRPRFAVQPMQLPPSGDLYEYSDEDADVSEDDGSDADSQDLSDDFESSSDSWDSSTDTESDSDSDAESNDGAEAVEPERRLSRNVSRNPSFVSLHYLLEAEEDVKAEADWPEIPLAVPADVEEKVPLDTAAPTSLNQLAAASSGWLFSRKKKPTMLDDVKETARTSSLNDKLQAHTSGVVTDIWEKAKANAMHLAPLHHMPELTAFPGMAMASMPAFLGGKTEASPSRVVDDSDADSDATTTEKTVAMERAANAASNRDWSAWFTTKSPSSPPPVYSPTDRLLSVVSPLQKSDKALALAPATMPSSISSSSSSASLTSIASTSGSITPRSQRDVRSRSDKLDLAIERKRQGVHQDRMLWLFWIPVLITVVSFAIYANFGHLRPALEQLAELILPRQLLSA